MRAPPERPADHPDLHVLLFARYPVPGRAKTRLVPALGAEAAARLHRRMTEEAVQAARALRATVTVCCTGAPRRAFRAWLGPGPGYEPQASGPLGRRLRFAFESAFRRGAMRAVAAGCDVPGLTPGLLRRAFDALGEKDAVLGPAADGGYYLIGMASPHPALFEGVDWGTGRVAAQTRDALRRAGLPWAELPEHADVDRPEDLAHLRADPRFADVFTGRPLLSVVVPALDEADRIAATLDRAREAEDVELLVVDGGSRDATRETAARHGATVLEAAGGRAVQMNAGAARAGGRHLLFLHADTRLPGDYADRVRAALDDPAVTGGAFRFRTDGAGAALRLVEAGVRLRSGLFQWPYGDQGLFLERRVFHELGGYATLPLLEDFDLVRRLRARGRVVTLPAAAVTSARRWTRLGVARATWRNQAVIAGYLLGIAPVRLARFYRRDPPSAR